MLNKNIKILKKQVEGRLKATKKREEGTARRLVVVRNGDRKNRRRRSRNECVDMKKDQDGHRLLAASGIAGIYFHINQARLGKMR